MADALKPQLRTFDEDALQAQAQGGAYAFAMGKGLGEPGRKSEPQGVEGKAIPPVGAPDAADRSVMGNLFVSAQFGPASQVKSIWGSDGYYGNLVTLELAGRARLTSPYAQDPTYFACLDKLSKAIGGLPWRLEREVMEDGEPRWVEVSAHGAPSGRGKMGSKVKATVAEAALLKLLNRPSPLHTGRAFRTAFVQHFLNDGEVLLMFMEPGGDRENPESAPLNKSQRLDADLETVPTYLWPVGGSQVHPMTEGAVGAMPRSFNLSDGKNWPAGSAAWCIMVTPDSATRGFGPGSAVRRKLEQSYQIDRFADALLRNGGMPSGFFYVPDRLDRNAKQAIKQNWKEQHGGAQNAGSIAVIDGGAEYKPSSMNPSEMQFSEMRDKNDEYVRMVMGATKPVLGITDDVNRANAHEAMRVWYEVTVKPLGDIVIDLLNVLFVDRLVPLRAGGARHRVCFDYSAVPFLREDADAKVERAIKVAEAFGLSGREAAGLAKWTEAVDSDVAGLDQVWIQNDRKPLEVALDPDSYKPAMGGQAPQPDAGKAVTKAESEEDDTEEATREWERRAFAALKAHDDLLRSREGATQRAAEKVLRSYVLAARKRLSEIADGKRATETPAAARARAKAEERGEPVRKYVANEAEIARALALNLAEWEKAMREDVLPEVGKSTVAGAAALNSEVNGGDVVLDLTDPAVVQFLADKEITLVEGATSTLAKDVQRKIVKVLAGAEEATSLSQAVQEVLDELKSEMATMLEGTGARAELIARTETASAVSFGRTEQMGIDGIERHTWVSSRDTEVRDEHEDLDGKTARVGEVFAYGLAYPGDGSHGASAAQICNCRCTTIPEID